MLREKMSKTHFLLPIIPVCTVKARNLATYGQFYAGKVGLSLLYV